MWNVYSFLFLIISFSIHEFSHAWFAYLLGDLTPKINGRLSLNPLRHVDPLGLISLIILKVGWGKPVPINPYNLRFGKWGEVIVSLSGPFSNFFIFFLATLLYIKIHPIFLVLAVISFNLGLFNLMPFSPLDGSHVLKNLLPRRLLFYWSQFEKISIFLLVAAIVPILPGGFSVFSFISSKILDIFFKLL
jgi:Zn-dependent protease